MWCTVHPRLAINDGLLHVRNIHYNIRVQIDELESGRFSLDNNMFDWLFTVMRLVVFTSRLLTCSISIAAGVVSDALVNAIRKYYRIISIPIVYIDRNSA